MLNDSVETAQSFMVDLTPRRQNYYPSSRSRSDNTNTAEEEEEESAPEQVVEGWSDIVISPSSKEHYSEQSPPPPPPPVATSGILIVPGGDDLSISPETTEYLYRTAMHLSLPGSESLPSDLASVRDPLALDAGSGLYHRPPVLITEEDEDPGTTTTAPRTGDRREQEPPLGTPLLVPNNRVSNRRSQRNTLLVAVVTIVSLLLAASTSFLLYERFMWKESNLRLLEQIDQLQEEVNRQKVKYEKVHREKSKKTPEYGLHWDGPSPTCHGDGSSFSSSYDDDEESTTVIDNCWLHARAKVGLGQCATEVKETVREKLEGLGHNLHEASTSVWKVMEDYLREETGTTTSKDQEDDIFETVGETIQKNLDEWGKSLWKSWESLTNDDGGDNNETHSDATSSSSSKKKNSKSNTARASSSSSDVSPETEKSSTTTFEDVATIASGVAFASIAAILTDQAVSYFAEIARDAVDDASFTNRFKGD